MLSFSRGGILENLNSETARALLEMFKSLDRIIHHRVWREVKLGEKPGQFLIMAKLHRSPEAKKGGLRISELAATFGITASSVTQMVTSLEGRGYVARSMDPNDRRAVRVFLTDTGACLIESAIASLNEIFIGLVDHLGEEKSRELVVLLTQAIEYFEALKVPRPALKMGPGAARPGIESGDPL